MQIQSLTIDTIFLIDIFVNFFSAFQNEDLVMIDDRKVICKSYLSSWFLLDMIAIFPFDLLTKIEGNSIVRVTRIGKLYKLIKVFRMVRLLKVFRQQKKLFGRLGTFFQWNKTVEKLAYFIVIFILTCHFLSCFWIFTADLSINDATQFLESEEVNWLTSREDFKSLDTASVYSLALYYTITTITTVGYGDISGTNTSERIICIFIMISGVFFFSYTSGTLTNMISNQEAENKQLNEKVMALNKLYEQHSLPTELYF